jgi:hypothetical protein
MSQGESSSTPLQSKKFVAFLVSYMAMVAVEVLVIISHWGQMPVTVTTVLLAFILIQGFIAAGYILGTASLDKYITVATLAAQNGHSLRMKGMDFTNENPRPPAGGTVSTDNSDEGETL